jgi:anti-sigma regulatory factor (Ser/Thr protein kinase)
MKEITVEASVDNVGVVTELVDSYLDSIECPVKSHMQIDIAIDELFSNIAYYAYKDGKGQATVKFDFDEAADVFTMQFIDQGVPFNPLQAKTPDITLSADERNLGGLGIYMVKKSMDDMIYSYENGNNILTIVKKLNG